MIKKKALVAKTARARQEHSPALTWLFLVGLLPSRAQLRFTRRRYFTREGIHKNPRKKIQEEQVVAVRFASALLLPKKMPSWAQRSV